MKTGLIGAALLIMASTVAPASAYEFYGPRHHSVVSERHHELARVIDRGVRSGEISRREATRLHAELRAIRAKERRYLADGILTRTERLDLARDLRIAERRIYNALADTRRHYVFRR
jgi:hypothetical protein